MISPSGAIAFATNCLTAWSRSSVDLRSPRCFGERGFDGLEEADVIADRDCFICSGTKGERLR